MRSRVNPKHLILGPSPTLHPLKWPRVHRRVHTRAGRPADGFTLRLPPGRCDLPTEDTRFAVSQRPSVQELRDPAGALERLTGAGGHFRLLPYRAVGVDRGLLLAVRVDRAVVDGEDRGAMVVALSPTPVSDGGGYGALLGEC